MAQVVILVSHAGELAQAGPQRLVLLQQVLQDVVLGRQRLCHGCGWAQLAGSQRGGDRCRLNGRHHIREHAMLGTPTPSPCAEGVRHHFLPT